ncbi:MAG: type II secretion system minor pseudopilin GspK [Hyphomonadaceae bacterium]|nr:type II secretion system minor pseudopilin GspK [Hyphomonadaceae bacterium]
MSRPSDNTSERGAVLITTLLLMSVMAVITVTIMDDIRFSIKRAASTQTAEQLAWYSRGGEDYARNWLGTQIDSDQKQLRKIILLQEPAIFPIEQGELQIRARDGRNCFNLNALAHPETGDEARQKLARLLTFLELGDAEAEMIAAGVRDWVDADSVPLQGGAEDFTYSRLEPAYRAANTPLADISELREINGIDEEIYQSIRPYVCVMRDTEQNLININTATLEDAAVIGALFGNADGFAAAQEVIADRPLAGYDNIEMIEDKDVVKDLEGNGAFGNLLQLKTDRIDLQIDILLGDQVRGYIAGFEIGDTSKVKLVSRRSTY